MTHWEAGWNAQGLCTDSLAPVPLAACGSSWLLPGWISPQLFSIFAMVFQHGEQSGGQAQHRACCTWWFSNVPGWKEALWTLWWEGTTVAELAAFWVTWQKVNIDFGTVYLIRVRDYMSIFSTVQESALSKSSLDHVWKCSNLAWFPFSFLEHGWGTEANGDKCCTKNIKTSRGSCPMQGGYRCRGKGSFCGSS